MNKIDEIAKEFYGQYGLAMHTVQFLEKGLIKLYDHHIRVNKNLTKVEYNKFRSKIDRLTLGQIKNKLFELKIFDDSTKKSLVKANKTRIFLAHKFWWDREIEFNSSEGLKKLSEEIFSYIKLYRNLIQIIEKMINKIRTDNNLKILEKMGL